MSRMIEEHNPMKHLVARAGDLGLRKVWANYCHRNLRQEGACASGTTIHIVQTLFQLRKHSLIPRPSITANTLNKEQEKLW